MMAQPVEKPRGNPVKFKVNCPYCDKQGADIVIRERPKRKVTIVRCNNPKCTSIVKP